MYAVSLTIAVNPPGSAPVLTREQVWRGLVLKAEDARPFVPGMTRCVVVERLGPDAFRREVEYRGARLVERITLAARVQVLFEREAEDPTANTNAGWITNVIGEMDGALVLSFTFAVRFPGMAEGSREEAEEGERMKGVYLEAVRHTLAMVRRLVEAREL